MARKQIGIIIFILALFFLLFFKNPVLANTNKEIMPIGTLLYKTSGNGLIYGKNTNKLLEIKNGILGTINPGHVGIYVGKDEKGTEMVVEAVNKGLIMDPLKYFINLSDGSQFLGAKIPKNSSKSQRLAAAEIAKALAKLNLKYDF